MLLSANNDNRPLHFAMTYLAGGLSPIPLKAKSKEPIDRDWRNLRLNSEELPKRFKPDQNIGIILGDASSGIVDVDLDDEYAIQLGPHILPRTDCIFGRPSSPNSHWIFRATEPGTIKQWLTDHMIVEVRANGGHTVFPGSVHDETGELIEFTTGSDKLPEPALIDRRNLDRLVDGIAIGAVIIPFWKKGLRHRLALALVGFLAKSGWVRADAERLISAIVS